MENFIQVLSVLITLALSLFIGILALFKNQSNKRNYFLLLQSMVILSLLGYLLEISANNAEEALTGAKVLNLGAYFTVVFTFLFTADYSNLKLHPVFFKTPLVLFTLTIIFLMWTTKYHGLIYFDYFFISGSYQYLSFTPGTLYFASHLYPVILMVLSVLIIFFQIKKWTGRYRKKLILLMVCLIIPFFFEGIYYINVFTRPNAQIFYITPYSMAIMSLCLFFCVLRYNIFEIISTATTTAMDHIREGFILVDEDNNYLSSNSAANSIIPQLADFKKGEPVFSIPLWPEELKKIDRDLVEFPITHDDTRYYRVSMSPVREKNRSVIAKIFLFREITDNVNLMKELENAAYMDSLTGIYNRKHFIELANMEINRALRQNQSIYSAMLDLDLFKKVNDTYGHTAGDAVLKKTAEVIHSAIRSYDLLGRYGGEEFVLLFSNLETEEALSLMERIRKNMENAIIVYEDIEITITCSIGLAKFDENDSLESSIKKADEALYTAKNAGRNLVKIYGTK